MKVLHVIPSLALTDGGPSQAVRRMEEALAAEGIAVETVTTDDDGPGRHLDRPLGVPVFEESGRCRRYFRKNTDRYKISWSLACWLLQSVRQYDVVHVHALFSFASVIAAWAALRAGVPLVIRPLGTLNGYGLQARRRGLKRWSIRFVEGPLVRRARAIHVTSEDERREVESLGLQARCVVIPLAVPPPLPLSCPVESFWPELCESRLVLFLSRLDPKKNVESLLQAWAELETDFPDCRLCIAGSGDSAYIATLHAHAAMLGLQRVDWVGQVGGEYKTALLQQATCFVLPSHSENFGIAVAEALAAGLPSIVGEGVALAQDIVDAGAGLPVVPAADAVAVALRRLLTHHAEREQMAVRARELGARFTVPALGRRLHDLYDSLLD